MHVDTPHIHEARSMTELVLSGDWACAHNTPETLAEVAHALGRCLTTPAQRVLDHIADLALTDMLAATTRWSELTRELSRHGALPGAGAPPYLDASR